VAAVFCGGSGFMWWLGVIGNDATTEQRRSCGGGVRSFEVSWVGWVVFRNIIL